MMDLPPIGKANLTLDPQFIIMGFSSYPQLQPLFFICFLLIFLLAVVGNLLIISIIALDSHLHTPMYFFLFNLAALDICGTTSLIPMLLELLLSETKAISFNACMTQMFVFSWVLGTELVLLAVMGLDRYVAICRPLHYLMIMSKKVYVSLALAVWIYGLYNSLIHTAFILRLSYNEKNVLDHFFCEIPPVIKVSISDAYTVKYICLVTDIYLTMFCSFLTAVSYIFIITSILKIRSADKKMKAFSTCVSHLLVVTLFYGGTVYTYTLPALGYGGEKDKVMSFIYAFISPAFNPIVYSLRNQEVKQSFMKNILRPILSLML